MYDEIDVGNFLPFDQEPEDENLDVMSFIKKSSKLETLEEKLRRWESYRKHELVKILTGKCPGVHTAKIYALLMRETHFTVEEGRMPQDVYLDAYKNTALHYALKPEIKGRLGYVELINATLSFNLPEVMSCHVNPHLPNVGGVTALELVDSWEVARELDQLTRCYRPYIYDRLAFAELYVRLNKNP